MKKNLPYLFLLLATLFFNGCASSDPRAAAQKANIRTVQVDPVVDMGPAMRYGLDNSGGGLSAIIAEAIVSGANADHIKDMSRLTQEQAIDLPKLVREGFTERLRKGKALTLTEKNPDGVIFLRVYQHGFASKGFEYSKKTPFALFSAILKDRSGNTVWVGSFGALALSQDGVGATFDEYRLTPGLLKRDWKVMIERGSDLILKDYLKEQQPSAPVSGAAKRR